MFTRIRSFILSNNHNDTINKAEAEFQSNLNKALKLCEWGAYREAISFFSYCLEIFPDRHFVHFQIAEAYAALEEKDSALIWYRRCLELDPSDPFGVTIKLVLAGEMAMPDTIPEKYIEQLFDQYAPYFEENLVGRLGYAVPAAIADCVIYRMERKQFDRVLDLGCGTGLSAAPFREMATIIEGVDLSQKMIEEADKKGVFDVLHCDTILNFLRHTDQEYDLVIAADLFIYAGRVEPYFQSVESRLKQGGLFALSIQTTEDDDIVLGADHKYSHRLDYIEKAAHEAGLKIKHTHQMAVRQEGDQSVKGHIFILTK